MSDNDKEYEEEIPDYKDTETCNALLKKILNNITPKYTKQYETIVEQEPFIM